MDDERNLVLRISAAIAGVVIVVTLVLFVFRPEREGDPNPAPLVEINVDQVAAARNRGVALLENSKWSESAEIFEELKRQLPDDLLSARNLAIARSGEYLEDFGAVASSDEAEASLAKAIKAIEALRQLEPEAPYSYRLNARLIDEITDAEKKVSLLEEAKSRDPEDPSIWFEIYRTAKVSRDESMRQLARDSIAKAYDLASHNISVVLDYLLVLNDAQDASISKVLKDVRPLFAPFRQRILQRAKSDVLQLVDEAIGGAEQQDWRKVRINVLTLANITRPDDVVRSDLIRIQSHSLEFALLNFGDDIERQIAEHHSESAPAVEISLVPQGGVPEFDSKVRRVQLLDFDLDQQLDLLVLTDNAFHVCRRLEDSNNWEIKASVELTNPYDDFLLIDIDNDADRIGRAGEEFLEGPTADLDVIVYGQSGLSVLETDLKSVGGELTITPNGASQRLLRLTSISKVVAGDLNQDGDLDLGLIADGEAQYWNNNSNFEFERIDFLGDRPDARAVDLLVVDWDRDIDQDLVVLHDDGTLGYFEGLRHGDFRWREFEQAVTMANPRSFVLQDVDRNGAWDLTVTGEGGVALLRTRVPELGDVQFLDPIQITGDGDADPIDWDLNLDGFRDVVCLQSGRVVVYSGANGAFSPPTELSTGDAEVTSLAVGDIDADGDADFVTTDGDGIVVHRNTSPNDLNWMEVGVIAEIYKGESQGSRINHYGVGTFIELRSGADYQLQLVQSPGAVRFGLGKNAKSDAVRIVWPNGIPINILDPASRQLVWERQTLGSSCPYLYAWNGEEFDFVTDLLWASPIGMTDHFGEIVPDRPWEYLKISGGQLKPRDGEYQLQVTEELWEAAYFDKIELIAVDHPIETHIFTNEKVGPPEIANHRIYSVQKKRHPVSAVNHAGRSILNEISQHDEVYAKSYEQKIMQGYTDDTFVEFDFGLTEKPEHLTLYLTGWMYPTDVNINRALFENKQLPGPKPPSILVPNDQGEFAEAIGYCGFPGGKTKTIAIDVSKIFLTEDYRIRLATSMELYWDEIFVSNRLTRDATDDAELGLVGCGPTFPGCFCQIGRY